ncbi:uncharacterized protein TNCV_563771 [Trichonephila clavipes]|nr:uncharacterized protein TNCV_563771 [Trichonephila clavipes]
MITNFFIPELNNHDVQELWFQQDGATCHTARATIDLLKDAFGDRLISRFGPVNGPPRSCDLTPLDYFISSRQKSQCDANSKIVSLVIGRRFSSQTIRNMVHAGSLYARRPKVCVPLTARHGVARRNGPSEHRDWMQSDWSRAVYGIILIQFKSDTGSVLARWHDSTGWISIGGHIDLYVIQNGNLSTQSATAKSPSEYMRKYRARKKKTLQNTLLMPSLRDGNAIETLLMTAQINTDLMNHPVPLTTEPSTSLVRFETDGCKSIINSILRYKDYDSHKNAHKDFQK